MSNRSPMMRRIAKSSTGRFNIPKKGRIRFALLLILIAAAVYFVTPLFNDKSKRAEKTQAPPENAAAAKDNPLSKDVSNKKKKKVKEVKANRAEVKETPKPPPVKKPEGQLDFEDVRRLVKQRGLDINTAQQITVNNKDTLTMWLSIDTGLQKYANQLLRRYKPRCGAVAAIDPVTGRVLALASYVGEGESITDNNLYLKSIFPAASVFKTVTAAAGIEKAGMNGKSEIPHYGGNHTLYLSQLQENLRVSRNVSLEDAYAYSINPAFARIALFMTNKDVLTDYGKRFGFNTPVPFELDADISEMFAPDSAFSVAEFASGFNRQTTISPLFGALMTGAVCENGSVPRPTVIDSIRSSKKEARVYVRSNEPWKRAVREHTAKELRGLMMNVARYGTARNTFRQMRQSPRFSGYEFGGKTGNVNKQGLGRVDWFVGFGRHPQDKNQRIAVGVVTAHGEYWTVHSSYVAAELIKKYLMSAQTRAEQTGGKQL